MLPDPWAYNVLHIANWVIDDVWQVAVSVKRCTMSRVRQRLTIYVVDYTYFKAQLHTIVVKHLFALQHTFSFTFSRITSPLSSYSTLLAVLLHSPHVFVLFNWFCISITITPHFWLFFTRWLISLHNDENKSLFKFNSTFGFGEKC